MDGNTGVMIGMALGFGFLVLREVCARVTSGIDRVCKTFDTRISEEANVALHAQTLAAAKHAGNLEGPEAVNNCEFVSAPPADGKAEWFCANVHCTATMEKQYPPLCIFCQELIPRKRRIDLNRRWKEGKITAQTYWDTAEAIATEIRSKKELN